MQSNLNVTYITNEKSALCLFLKYIGAFQPAVLTDVTDANKYSGPSQDSNRLPGSKFVFSPLSKTPHIHFNWKQQ